MTKLKRKYGLGLGYNRHLGSVAQKVLILLAGGFSLGLAVTPGRYARVFREMSKEWEAINRRRLKQVIHNLYSSKLVDYRENSDDTISIVLTEDGRKRILTHNLESIKIKKPTRWDGLWRVIIFDIPEFKKKARDALVNRFKQIGLYPLQKSVFIYPYDCYDEVNFITEIFDLKPYVRIMLVKKIDVDLHLREIFKGILT